MDAREVRPTGGMVDKLVELCVLSLVSAPMVVLGEETVFRDELHSNGM